MHPTTTSTTNLSLADRFKRIICLIFNIRWHDPDEQPTRAEMVQAELMQRLGRALSDSIEAQRQTTELVLKYFTTRDLGFQSPPPAPEPNPDEDWLKRYMEAQQKQYESRPDAPIPAEVAPDYDPNDDPSLPAALRP